MLEIGSLETKHDVVDLLMAALVGRCMTGKLFVYANGEVSSSCSIISSHVFSLSSSTRPLNFIHLVVYLINNAFQSQKSFLLQQTRSIWLIVPLISSLSTPTPSLSLMLKVLLLLLVPSCHHLTSSHCVGLVSSPQPHHPSWRMLTLPHHILSYHLRTNISRLFSQCISSSNFSLQILYRWQVHATFGLGYKCCRWLLSQASCTSWRDSISSSQILHDRQRHDCTSEFNGKYCFSSCFSVYQFDSNRNRCCFCYY